MRAPDHAHYLHRDAWTFEVAAALALDIDPDEAAAARAARDRQRDTVVGLGEAEAIVRRMQSPGVTHEDRLDAVEALIRRAEDARTIGALAATYRPGPLGGAFLVSPAEWRRWVATQTNIPVPDAWLNRPGQAPAGGGSPPRDPVETAAAALLHYLIESTRGDRFGSLAHPNAIAIARALDGSLPVRGNSQRALSERVGRLLQGDRVVSGRQHRAQRKQVRSLANACLSYLVEHRGLDGAKVLAKLAIDRTILAPSKGLLGK